MILLYLIRFYYKAKSWSPYLKLHFRVYFNRDERVYKQKANGQLKFQSFLIKFIQNKQTSYLGFFEAKKETRWRLKFFAEHSVNFRAIMISNPFEEKLLQLVHWVVQSCQVGCCWHPFNSVHFEGGGVTDFKGVIHKPRGQNFGYF